MKTYWICEYLFTPLGDVITFWDRVWGYTTQSVRGLILIEAEDKDSAEEKFLVYFNKRHPGRKLGAWDIKDTVV